MGAINKLDIVSSILTIIRWNIGKFHINWGFNTRICSCWFFLPWIQHTLSFTKLCTQGWSYIYLMRNQGISYMRHQRYDSNLILHHSILLWNSDLNCYLYPLHSFLWLKYLWMVLYPIYLKLLNFYQVHLLLKMLLPFYLLAYWFFVKSILIFSNLRVLHFST